MNYKNGLPIINIPLPSRKIFCCFFLKPINENVNDFCRNIASEDKGIDFLALYTLGFFIFYYFFIKIFNIKI